MQEIPNIKMNPIKSSAAAACGFDPGSGCLAVQFRSGDKTYHFKATQDDYDTLMGAESFGRQWHKTKGNLSKFNDEE